MLNPLGVAFPTNYTFIFICSADVVDKIKVLGTRIVKMNYLLVYKSIPFSV